MKSKILLILGIFSIVFVSGCISTGDVISRDNEYQESSSDDIQICKPSWVCTEWSQCSQSGVQTRKCSDSNDCDDDSSKPKERRDCIPPKIKEATLEIDRVQITLANLYPTRVTVKNTGDVKICPEFDVFVYDDSSEEVCYGNPFSPFGCLSPGEKDTDEIMIMGCMFSEDGNYLLVIDLLDEDYNKLDSEQEVFSVDYWNKFAF